MNEISSRQGGAYMGTDIKQNPLDNEIMKIKGPNRGFIPDQVYGYVIGLSVQNPFDETTGKPRNNDIVYYTGGIKARDCVQYFTTYRNKAHIYLTYEDALQALPNIQNLIKQKPEPYNAAYDALAYFNTSYTGEDRERRLFTFIKPITAALMVESVELTPLENQP